MYQEKPVQYFASQNTSKGFINHFSSVFNPEEINKIYIIKGGPGTGKSSLMRSLEAIAKEKGLAVEAFHCSSDPSSLDGLIIDNNRVAILDGTSPHLSDPTYPGAVENIINTGSFWNTEILMQKKKQIIRLIQEKNRFYKRAYRFLKAYGEIEDEMSKIYEKSLLEEKMEKNAKKTIEKYLSFSKIGTEKVRLTESITANGMTKSSAFSDHAKQIICLWGNEYLALRYIKMLYRNLSEKKTEMLISYSAKFPDCINEIYFPQSKTAVLISDTKHEPSDSKKQYYYINMKRFSDPKALQERIQKLHFGKKCSKMLLCGASEALSEAKEVHQELEKIYISSMDFDRFNLERESLIQQIFKE